MLILPVRPNFLDRSPKSCDTKLLLLHPPKSRHL